MGFIKRSNIIGAALTLALAGATQAYAVEDTKLSNIAQNCATIKRSLTQLQRADSRTRAYLGTSYETIANNFITPLNVRLIKNNQPDSTIFTIQSEFTEMHARFRTEYTDYMRELEGLIGVNCQNNPQGFYDRLEATRNHRAALQNVVVRLGELIQEQDKAVAKLREGI